jgi:hypothetical protein
VKSLQKKQKLSRKDAKPLRLRKEKQKKKTLRILCVSAPLRAPLIFFFGCGSPALGDIKFSDINFGEYQR